MVSGAYKGHSQRVAYSPDGRHVTSGSRIREPPQSNMEHRTPKPTSSPLRDLISEPFGPYPDHIILSEKCKTVRKEAATLTELVMTCNGTLIGFDETEAYPSKRIKNHPVLFSGILEIKRLSWLSPTGVKYLEADLQKRWNDYESAGQSQKRGGSARGTVNGNGRITLAKMYGEHEGGGVREGDVFGKRNGALKIKVWVKGEKAMSALFMTSDKLPNGLLMGSKDQYRQYEIESMDVEIFHLSREFQARYRLLALMHDIVDTDPDHTPLEERDIDYFTTAYLARYAFTDSFHRYHRPFSHPDDSDVDSEGNTTLPRHPPHISRAEIKGLIASQADWILADQLAKNADKRVVDTGIWYAVCKEVKHARREARANGYRWGIPLWRESESEDSDSSVDFSKISILGRTRQALEKKKQELKTRAKSKPKKKASKKRAHSQSIPSTSAGRPLTPDDDYQVFKRLPNIYDSDFSEVSTPPASDSDDVSDSPLDPEICNLLHPCFTTPPELPHGDFKWWCPLPSCRYVIDMLNLTDENVLALDPEQANYLRSRRWSMIREKTVVFNFGMMVSAHYQAHLHGDGLQLTGQFTKKCAPEWLQPKRQRPWPPPEPSEEEVVARPRTPEVQAEREEAEIALMLAPLRATPAVPRQIGSESARASSSRSRAR